MAISWVPRGLSCCLRLGTPESWQGLSGEPGKSEGQGCTLLFPLESKSMGRSKPCIPVPSSSLESGSAGASQGAPPARPLLVGPATLYQGNLPAFLGWPGQSSHHLTSLSSSYVPEPGWVTPGCNLAMAPGFPTGWHFGQPLLAPPRPPFWPPGIRITMFFEGDGLRNLDHCQSGNRGLYLTHTAVTKGLTSFF